MKIIAYLSKVMKLVLEFKEFLIEQLPRNINSNSTTLANLGFSISSEFKRTILLDILARMLKLEESCNIETIE